MKTISNFPKQRSFKKISTITTAGLWDWLFTLNKNEKSKDLNIQTYSKSKINERQKKLIHIYRNNSIQRLISRDISNQSINL